MFLININFLYSFIMFESIFLRNELILCLKRLLDYISRDINTILELAKVTSVTAEYVELTNRMTF